MPPSYPPLALPTLEQAIDRHPPTVTPDTPLVEVIALMSQIGQGNRPSPTKSFILVMEGTTLLGVFTAANLVRLIAAGGHVVGVKIADVMTQAIVTLRQSEASSVVLALLRMQQYQIHHLPVVRPQSRG